METTKGMTFGAPISKTKSISTDELAVLLLKEATKVDVKVRGEVVEVCKNEGCWIRLKTSDGSLLVKMKDHAFLVPVSMVGHTVEVEGTAAIKETSVEMQRHLAEDAGKTKEEIAAITQPSNDPVLQAKGLVVTD